jgi:hypothetical protein
MSIYYKFIKACRNGDLYIMKRLYNDNNDINIYFNNGEIYKVALSINNNDIVNWLFEISNAKIYYNASLKQNIFLNALLNNKLELAKFLVDQVDIHFSNDIALINSCYFGNLESVKWLMSLDDKPDIHIDSESPFMLACQGGRIEIIKWMMTLDDKPNIRIKDDEAFKNACFDWKPNIEVAKLLVSLCSDYYIKIIGGKIERYEINNRLEYLFETKQYNKIIDKLNIKINNNLIIRPEDKCAICFSENYNFISSCNHTFCLECFLTWYIVHEKTTCSYCIQHINIELCSVKY